MPNCSFSYVTLPFFLFYRKRFGKNNVILSDIRKPPSNVFHSGESCNRTLSQPTELS